MVEEAGMGGTRLFRPMDQLPAKTYQGIRLFLRTPQREYKTVTGVLLLSHWQILFYSHDGKIDLTASYTSLYGTEAKRTEGPVVTVRPLPCLHHSHPSFLVNLCILMIPYVLCNIWRACHCWSAFCPLPLFVPLIASTSCN